jgi:transketolase
MIEKKIRNIIVKLSYYTNSPHLGSSLSCVEILVSIFEFIKNKDKKFEVIFSKGHAAMAYYATLYAYKKIPKNDIDNYLKPKTTLWSHISKTNNSYLKFGFGALGYGLGIAAGMSLGYEIEKKKHTIFCILSDGELNEGSIWESLMFISHHNLKNIIILIDRNQLQSFGFTNEIINLNSYKKKFQSFNFDFFEIDGHNITSLIKIYKSNTRKPKIVLCNTIKGKGVKRIEGKLSSHYYPAQKEDLEFNK